MISLRLRQASPDWPLSSIRTPCGAKAPFQFFDRSRGVASGGRPTSGWRRRSQVWQLR